MVKEFPTPVMWNKEEWWIGLAVFTKG